MLSLQIMVLRKYIILLSIVLLTACAGNSAIKPTAKPPSVSATSSKQTSVENASPKPGSGGYYLDDGPGENAPAEIDSIPGATLKTEQPYTRSNKPYMALGQQYAPMTTFVPYKKQGIASWYGKRFHGKKTSIGEIYDMYAMTAAHTILPIPSYAKVTNPANGRSVTVRINDRGPFKHDRLIDLSYAAAYQLRLIKQGSGVVVVESIDTRAEAMQKISSGKLVQATSLPENPSVITQAAPIEPKVTPQPVNFATAVVTSTPLVISTPAVISTPMAAPSSPVNALDTQYYVQAGAFKNEVNGDLLQKKILGLDLVENVGVANVYNNGLYRVKLGPYASKKDADTSAANIRKQLNIAALVINQ